jgi:hypothetical protein
MDAPPGCPDKFFKVRPLIETIRKQCMLKPVEENVSVDEQMIPFKGILSIRQYMPKKPSKWGIKVFVLAGVSGYPYDFILYQGSKTEIPPQFKPFGSGAAIVIHLSERLQSSGHNIYFDNYFSSYQLFEVMSEKKQNAIGTIRVNRFKNPPFKTDKEMKKEGRGASDHVASRDGKVILYKWLDTKFVYLASNTYSSSKLNKVDRFCKAENKSIEISQPDIISKYNSGMGGVDLLDQLISYYRIHIKSRKWTLRLIFHFADLAVVSSFIDFNQNKIKLGEKKWTLIEYRLYLAECLTKVGHQHNDPQNTNASASRQIAQVSIDIAEEPPVRKAKMESLPIREVVKDSVGHLPLHDDKGKFGTRCKRKGCTGKTRIFCCKCQAHFCLTAERNCFYNVHT